MAVDIDEARGDGEAGGVDLAPGGAFYLPDGDDPALADGDVGLPGRSASAVDDAAAANEQIVAWVGHSEGQPIA